SYRPGRPAGRSRPVVLTSSARRSARPVLPLRAARLARIWLPVESAPGPCGRESRRGGNVDGGIRGDGPQPMMHPEAPVKVRLLGFGSIDVNGREYEHDVVIEGGRVRPRKKKPSKPYRNEFGHTPLSAEEELPWGGNRLIIGTGASGSLPIMAEVVEEANRRGVDLAALPTDDACRLIASLDEREVYAVLHVTC